MTRNLMALALALVAVFATSTVAATVASADELTSESSPVRLTGKQVEVFGDSFTVTTGTSKCKESSYAGTTVTPTTTITLTPTYPAKDVFTAQNCTAFGFPAEVQTNGCTYRFQVGGAGSTFGTFDVVCPAGKEITITSVSAGTTKCIVHIPAQSGLGIVLYKNLGAGSTREVSIEANLSGLKYSHTAGSGLGSCTTGSAGSGSYTSAVRMTGEQDQAGGSHVGIFLS